MQLRLSELSEDTKDVIITEWYVSESDRITEGQDLLEVATDKATFEVPSPCDGIIGKIIKRKGESVTADVVIADIWEGSVK